MYSTGSLTVSGTLTNTGMINIGSNSSLGPSQGFVTAGGLINTGGINMPGAGALQVNGDATNSGGIGGARLNLSVSGNLVNSGGIMSGDSEGGADLNTIVSHTTGHRQIPLVAVFRGQSGTITVSGSSFYSPSVTIKGTLTNSQGQNSMYPATSCRSPLAVLLMRGL